MDGKKCLNCSERRNCGDSFTSWIFFIVGLISTVAMRVVTVLMHLDPLYGKMAWYVGLLGFFLFFVYKFRVSQARSRLIMQRDLIRKINSKEALSNRDYGIISALLCGINSN
ncbi:MAG: hypothetical protein JW800_00440, partial [Candidatus Omnitrophica bacterium]|nr:hypothetical protein [Candidatus Omnitrophota bacterium]